jgi:hypothetical protein
MVTTFGLLNRVLEKMHLMNVGLAGVVVWAYT